ICILPDTHYYFAMVIAERIRRTVAESAQTLLPEQSQLSLAYGMATYPLDSDKSEELIRTCDVRLYEAKVAHRAQRKKAAVERRENPRIKTPGVCGVFFKTHLEKWDIHLLDIGPGGLSFLCPQSAESGIYQMQLFLPPPFSTAWVTVEPCYLQHL